MVFSVLAYGLDTVAFTHELRNRLDDSQAKCYRNVLKIRAAYYSRVSNKGVLDKVSILLCKESGKVSPMNKQIRDKSITLFGHIVRSDKDGHMRKVAVEAEFKKVERLKMRAERPRFYWLQCTMSRA